MIVELTPAGKVMALLLLALGAVALVLTQAPDARRYLKIESM